MGERGGGNGGRERGREGRREEKGERKNKKDRVREAWVYPPESTSAAHLWTPVELQTEIIPHLALVNVPLRNPGMSSGGG